MHWIGAKFCVCMFLDSRDKSVNKVRFPWIPRTNICNENIVDTLVLLRFPQRANNVIVRAKVVVPDSATVSGFANVRKVRKTMRIPLTICAYRIHLWFPRQLMFTQHVYYYFFMDSTNCWDSAKFEASSAKLPVFGAVLSNTGFQLFVRGI